MGQLSPPPGNGGRETSRLFLLGGWRLERGGGVQRLPVSGQRLLAFLCLYGKSSRPRLAASLWPEANERHAQGSLRSVLWRIHKSQPDLLVADDGSLGLDASVGIDVRDLLGAVGRFRRGVVPPPGVELPWSLLECELLPGWYDDWVLFERERLRQVRLHGLEALAGGLAAQGRYAAALDAGMAAVRAEPLRESAHRVVIGVHLAEGNVTEARRHHDLCRRWFLAELGQEPSAMFTGLLPPSSRPEPSGP